MVVLIHQRGVKPTCTISLVTLGDLANVRLPLGEKEQKNGMWLHEGLALWDDTGTQKNPDSIYTLHVTRQASTGEILFKPEPTTSLSCFQRNGKPPKQHSVLYPLRFGKVLLR